MEPLIRKIFPYIIAALFPWAAAAQSDCYFAPERHDVGVVGGATFYLGDLTDNYSLFRNFSFYGGGIYRLNFNEYYALRAQVAGGQLRGSMLRPDMPSTNNGEPWEFKRTMFFLDVAAEIGFFPLNIDTHKEKRWTPYLLLGVGTALLAPDKNIFFDDYDGQVFCDYLLLGVGAKWVPVNRITIGVEWMMRKTFTDKIDYYSSPGGSQLINKDWIGTIGLSLTYRLKEHRQCPAYQKYAPLTEPLKGRLTQ